MWNVVVFVIRDLEVDQARFSAGEPPLKRGQEAKSSSTTRAVNPAGLNVLQLLSRTEKVGSVLIYRFVLRGTKGSRNLPTMAPPGTLQNLRLYQRDSVRRLRRDGERQRKNYIKLLSR